MSTQDIFLRFLIISLAMTTTNLSVSAAQVLSKYPIWLRFGNDSVRVLFTSGNGLDATLYDNNENCGNAAHKTHKGARYFKHAHFSLPWGATGTDLMGTTPVGTVRSLTTDALKAYWDHHWGIPQRWGTTSSGGESVSTNCWAYAFGYSTWVEDPSYIYADDYEPISQPETNCVIQQSGHVIKISDVVTYETGDKAVSSTSEKMNMSGIYNINYFLPAGASLDGVLGGSLYRKKN